MRPRLLLVGAGHAHLEILRRLARLSDFGCDVTLLSPVERHVYSGMVPGFIAGQYSFEDVSADVGAMAQAAHAALVRGRAMRLDPLARLVHLEDGQALPYDFVSFNVGSRTIRGDDADVAAHALVLKPFELIRDVRARLEALSGRSPAPPVTEPTTQPTTQPPRVLVVGAGAAGFEVGCAADAVLMRGGHSGAVTLLEAGPTLLPGYSGSVIRIARRVLTERNILLRAGQRVARVEEAGVLLETGERVGADLVLWLVGTTSMPTFEGCGLPLDARGYLLVDGYLRSCADPRVFAVGDCATLADYPDTPKAGVYAVRETPILAANLLAVARGEEPRAQYVPQGSFLSLLNTGDGRAVLRWKWIAAHAGWCWRLKDHIDRTFMARFLR